MFCDINFLALFTFGFYTILAQLLLRENGYGDARYKGNSGNRLKSAVLCPDAGNCTCMFEKFHVTVNCTSAVDKFDEIASHLPKTTTHL